MPWSFFTRAPSSSSGFAITTTLVSWIRVRITSPRGLQADLPSTYSALTSGSLSKSSDDAGSRLDGLPRGVVANAPVERNFTVLGIKQRKFAFKRRQMSLMVGCLSSVYCSQGKKLRKVILDIRTPRGHSSIVPPLPSPLLAQRARMTSISPSPSPSKISTSLRMRTPSPSSTTFAVVTEPP